MRISDWSSDVCSADLAGVGTTGQAGNGTSQSSAAGKGASAENAAAGAAGGTSAGQAGSGTTAASAGDKGNGSSEAAGGRSEEHTSELQSLMRISYAVFCLKKKKQTKTQQHI